MKIALLKQNVTHMCAVAVMAIGMSSISAYAVDSIDDVTHYVHQVLTSRGPNDAYKTELRQCFDHQLIELASFIDDFLDHSLDGSTKAFTERLEKDMRNYRDKVLLKIGRAGAEHNDAQVLAVFNKVKYLYHEFELLAAVIHANKDQKSPWVVAPLLLPYKHLIPSSIQKKYDKPTIILEALKHRLRCRGKHTHKLNMVAAAAVANVASQAMDVDASETAPMELE